MPRYFNDIEADALASCTSDPARLLAHQLSKKLLAHQLSKKLLACTTDKDALVKLEAAKPGVDVVNAANGHGYTLLMMCALGARPLCCSWLLRQGADPNARSPIGEGALSLSVVGESLACFEAILDGGADPREVDLDGNTVMHKSVGFPTKAGRKIVELAAEAGALAHQPNHRGLTPANLLGNMGQRSAYAHMAALAERSAIREAVASSPAAAEPERGRASLRI